MMIQGSNFNSLNCFCHSHGWRASKFTFVLFRDLLALSTVGLSFTGFLPVTTSKMVGRSFIMLNKRFLLSERHKTHDL